MNGLWSQYSKLRLASTPKSYASTAATTEWINMALYDKVRFIVPTGAWAGGTAAVTLNQGKTASGGSSKALGFSYYYTNDGATTTDTLTATASTGTSPSSTFNLDTASSLYVVEVNASMLDVDNGFFWVNMAIATPGANADFYAILVEGFGSRYNRGLSSPTMLT